LKTIQIIKYNLLQWLIILICLPVLIPLALIHPKRKQTFFKRLGFQSLDQHENPIWVHALSVGEVLSAFPIIEGLRKQWPNQPIVFSASTLTGYDMAQKIQPYVDEIIYYPYDFIFSVQWMIKKVNPKMFILVESDIWPNFLAHLHRKHIPAILLNGRLSKESLKGYQLFRGFMQPSLKSLTGICAQSNTQKDRFLSFDVEPSRIIVSGNVKFDQKRHQMSKDAIDNLKASLGVTDKTRIIIAGSTHEGEETILIDAFIRLRNQSPDLKLIIAPRDPGRGTEIQAICQLHNLSMVYFSNQKPFHKDILIVDQMGVLGKLYAIADIAFVGGSMVSEGGHNPLEPASMAKPVVFGSDMHDFPEVSECLVNEKAAFQVNSPKELYQKFQLLLNDTALARQCGLKGKQIVQNNQGAVQNCISFLDKLMIAIWP